MRTEVMGVVNATPDSFSDGGRYCRPEEAIRRAKNLIEDGADIIDLGAESTRPGVTPIDAETEWTRLEPILAGMKPIFAGNGEVRLSLDTYHPETMRRALEFGVRIFNCVYEEPARAMLDEFMSVSGLEFVVPAKCRAQVSDLSRVYLDPMIGFGTTREEDLELLRSVPTLAKCGRVLVGASRKRIVKRLTGEKVTGKNLGGNLAIAVHAALGGAKCVRVHDVAETVQALRVFEALSQ